MYKVIRFLELMWLVIAVCCVVIGTYKFFTNPDYVDALFFYVFAALAVILYFLRRRQRKGMEQNASEK